LSIPGIGVPLDLHICIINWIKLLSQIVGITVVTMLYSRYYAYKDIIRLGVYV
jgi:hypothetical protein